MISLDDFECATEVGAESGVIVVLAGNRVARLGECRKYWSGEIFDRGRLEREVDWLAILLEQNTGKNALDQSADVQPFVGRALETTVVQVVAIDINACSSRCCMRLFG